MPDITFDLPDELLEKINDGTIVVNDEGGIAGLDRVSGPALAAALLAIRSQVALARGPRPPVKGQQLAGYYVGGVKTTLPARLPIQFSLPHVIVATFPGRAIPAVFVEGSGTDWPGYVQHVDALEIFGIPDVETPFQDDPPPLPTPEP